MFKSIQDEDQTSLYVILDQFPDALETVGEHNATVRDKTPLMFAMQCRNISLAHALLDRGANASAVMPGGPCSSALELCVEFAYCDELRHDDWIRLATRLLDEGADPTSALWLALHSFGGLVKRADLIRLLLDRGANPDQMVGNSGNTARELVEINRHRYTDEVLRLFHFKTAESPPKPGDADHAKNEPVEPPLVQHPNGDFETAVEAMAFAIRWLRTLPEWDKWIAFEAQGMGHRVDSFHFATIRIRQNELRIDGPEVLDSELVAKLARVADLCLEKKGNFYSIAKATPKQASRVLDVIFRHYLGIRPHTGEGDDYAFGAKW
jgi:hypothetical protein